MKKNLSWIIVLALVVVLLGYRVLSGPGPASADVTPEPAQTQEAAAQPEATATTEAATQIAATDTATLPTPTPALLESPKGFVPELSVPFKASDAPEYDPDQPYRTVHGGVPYFEGFVADETTEAFELFSELDELGRCGTAFANVCRELMPTGSRESIYSVKPTGWQSSLYDNVDGQSLYNRCHLLAYQLTGENANPQNLITGTRYMNTEGMIPFENLVGDYVKETGNHVLYRVTPIFEGDNLVASGVLMEGWSVEDRGEGVCFCAYAYNVQPGIIIDYATGDNELAEPNGTVRSYILNRNSKKFHAMDCPDVNTISESNRQQYTGTREDLIRQGYAPHRNCNP